MTFRPFNNEAEGGPWCYWGGPGADYKWTVSGKTLTLTPVGGKDALRAARLRLGRGVDARR